MGFEFNPLLDDGLDYDSGAKGDPGAAGVGVISGGTENQVLAKNSDNDFDMKWTDQGGYTLPTASASVLGGIKIGTRLSIDVNGVLSADVQTTDISGKVDKVTGKGLSTNDYTTVEQTKLSGIEAGANNYTHPANHAPSIITQDASNRFVTDTEKSTWNGKQPAGSYLVAADISGKEDSANKSINLVTDGASDVKYPSVKSVKTYVDSAVAGLLDYRGAYDASGNSYPATGGSGTAGAILKGDMYIVSVGGVLNSKTIHIGDYIIALVDAPGQTNGNWDTLDTNLGYTPENLANKVTSISGASTDTQYGSAKLLYDQLVLKEAVANKENVTIDTSTTKYPTINLLKTGLDAKLGLHATADDSLKLGGNLANTYAPLVSPSFTAPVLGVASGVSILLDQGALDTNILEFRSSDVTQPATTVENTNTWGKIIKASPTTGGMLLKGYTDAEGTSALHLVGTVAPTAPNAARGAVRITGFKSDGAGGEALLGADDAVLALFTGTVGLGFWTAMGAQYYKTGSADPATLANYAQVYAKDVSASAEIFVQDEAGNKTQISPHDPETGEWIFYSENIYTGRRVKIEMESFIKDVQSVLGDKLQKNYFVEDSLPEEEIQKWEDRRVPEDQEYTKGEIAELKQEQPAQFIVDSLSEN